MKTEHVFGKSSPSRIELQTSVSVRKCFTTAPTDEQKILSWTAYMTNRPFVAHKILFHSPVYIKLIHTLKQTSTIAYTVHTHMYLFFIEIRQNTLDNITENSQRAALIPFGRTTLLNTIIVDMLLFNYTQQ